MGLKATELLVMRISATRLRVAAGPQIRRRRSCENETGRSSRVVGNTEISIPLHETSVLPVNRPESIQMEHLEFLDTWASFSEYDRVLPITVIRVVQRCVCEAFSSTRALMSQYLSRR